MLSRLLVVAVVLTSLLGTTASAGTSPPGVNLRWDQCYADFGAQYKTFACNTNSGSERMIASFELTAAPAEPVSGLEVYMDVASLGPLPAWWQMKNAGTCRQTSLASNNALPAGAVNCVDWADGQAAGGIGAYNIGIRGPSTAQIVAAFAVPASALATLSPGQEYFAFAIQVNHAKTVGTGSCAGCQTPAVIFLSSIKITTPVPSADIKLTQGANWSGSPWVSWQMGYPLNITRGCGMFLNGNCAFPYTRYDVVTYDATPTRTSTWGQVKALYR